MKKLLVGLLALGSISAVANDYKVYTTDCVISSQEATISNPKSQQHNNKISFQITAVGLNGSGKILKESLNSNRIDLVEPIVSGLYLRKRICFECNNFVGKRHLGLKLNIDAAAAQNILEHNSGELIPGLPRGINEFKVNPKNISWNHGLRDYAFETKKRFQIHFEPNELDGLSYHIMLSCTQKLNL